MASVSELPLITLEQYLDTPLFYEQRIEFDNGYITASAGTTVRHSLIAVNLIAFFRTRLRPPCQTLDSHVRIWIERYRKVVFPNLFLLCCEPRFINQRKDTIHNPECVFEILSPSTERQDRGSKLDWYRSLPSVRDVLLISQTEQFVEHVQRAACDQWTITGYHRADDLLLLCGEQLPVSAVYQGIDL